MDGAVPSEAQSEKDREAVISAWAARLDEAALERQYRESDGLIVMPELLPRALVDEMVAEARKLAPRVVRKVAPLMRRGGAIAHPAIVAEAPAMHALHMSPALLAMFSRVTGVPLEHRDPHETHASALYSYVGGDWMDWHFDECGCQPGDSFSTIIGLVDESSARLEVETRKDGPSPLRRSIHTVPGTFAFFCGTRAFHRVTKLAPGEERITFAFTYIRRGRKPGGVYNFRMKLGNAFVYFGVRTLFQR
jgi:hypothetical protein